MRIVLPLVGRAVIGLTGTRRRGSPRKQKIPD